MRGKIIVFGILWLACWRTALATTQLLVNGAFSSTTYAPWQVGGPASVGVRFGSGYASMGNANSAQQLLYQTFTFPTNLIGATLSLYYQAVSTDPNGDDSLTIYITDANLNPLLNLGTTTSANTTSGYTYITTNFITYAGSNLFSSYAGQLLNVAFAVTTDPTYGVDTSFYLTDVSLLAGTTLDIPANDNFTNAALIPSDGITNAVTTTYASRETGEPDIAGNKGGHSLWWTWTAPAIGTVTINTAGSDFYTLLGVYTGSSLTNLTVVTNSNGAKLSSGLAFVKFMATKGTQYDISLDGYNGDSGYAGFTFIFATDITPPKVTITSPKAAEHCSNSLFNVTGTVKDSVGVDAVWYQLNTNAWSTNVNTANGYANWTVPVSLTQGPNKIKVYAQDAAGNISITNSVSFLYVLSTTLQVQTNGLGKISPNYNDALLAINTNYSMTAMAGKGYVFSNWTGSTGAVLTNGPVLKFTMASNLIFTANFIPNPFTLSAGTYEGLFYDTNADGLTQAGSGFFSALVNTNGSFTAKFLQGSKSFPVSGKFSLTGGWFTNALKSWDSTALSLQLDLTNGDNLEGGLTNPLWTAELGADRAVFSKSNPSLQAGHYTLILPGATGTNSALLPGGNGFGAVTVDTSGSVTFSGKLGDGTAVTQSAMESGQRQWPLYVSLDLGHGMLLGWLTFTNEPDRDLDGMLNWFKPAQPATKLYPAGFTNEIRAAGSVYSLPKGARVLELTNGYVLLEDGGLAQSISNQFFLAANNIVAGSNKMHLTLTSSTGLFQGTATNGSGIISFSGAVLQKQTNGFGQFLNGAQSGGVSVTNE